MQSFIINKYPCIISSNNFNSLKMLFVYIASLKYNNGTNPTPVDKRNSPIHVQLPIHDKILKKKRIYGNCVACKLTCVYLCFDASR